MNKLSFVKFVRGGGKTPLAYRAIRSGYYLNFGAYVDGL